MAKKQYPLELILRAHGPAELVDADDNMLWASDADEEFKEMLPDEFLSEDDIDEILNYLADEEIISDKEFDFFASQHWEVTVETMDDQVSEPDDEEDDDED
jgi:hypothetical protein